MSVSGEVFLTKLLNMSLAGGAVILLVLVLRLLLKKAPAGFRFALWLLVLVRLLWPFTVPSPLSLLPVRAEALAEMPVEEGVIPRINTGISVIDEPVNLFFERSMMPKPEASADPAQIWGAVAEAVWLSGFLAFLGINLLRYIGMKKRLGDAVPGEEGVYYSDRLSMPMVLGFLKPGIYLPSLFLREENEEEKQFVLSHERCHIKRGDHLAKLAGFAALSVHWFNPLVWLAFVLFCKDMEMACDERVMRELGEDTKKEYSLALLRFSERQSGLFIPLAFGESHTKTRIKNILNYKKPAFWVTAAAVLLLAFAAVTLLTDPVAKSVSVIGGAAGPTSIFIAGKTGGGSGGEKETEAEALDLETVKNQPFGTAVELDYVTEGKIAMHGSFGYLSFQLTADGDDKQSSGLKCAVSFSEIGGIKMQGDSYTEIVCAGNGDAVIILPDVHNPEVPDKKMYVYDEITNTLSGPMNSSEEFWEGLTGRTGPIFADAPVVEEYFTELSGKVREQFGSQLLYGPVVVPEYNMNVYGFLAADGENLRDVWYGLWWEGEGLERIVKAELFEK